MATQPQPDASSGSPDVLLEPDILASADRIGKRKRAWHTPNNSLAVGIISAAVAALTSLLVSLVIAHLHSEDAVTRAGSGQQVNSVGQLEIAANALYQSTISVYNFQQECAQSQMTWAKCVGLAPGFPDYSAAITAFNEDVSKVTDAAAVRLANTFGNESASITLASSALNGQKTLPGMQASYDRLITLCGQLAREH
jgi:hypothetical protein